MTAELSYPDTLQYTAEHIWVRKEDDRLFVGITDFAQDQLGEVVFVDVPETGETFEGNAVFGSIESMKTVSELYMPVTGKVDAVNTELEDNPGLVNGAPYTDGWILQVTDFDADALAALLTAAGYRETLEA